MYSTQFEHAWSLYPRKIAKAAAYKKFNLALKRTDYETVVRGIAQYAESVKHTDKQYILHFSTFLNQERYLDDYEAGSASHNSQNPNANGRAGSTGSAISTALEIFQKKTRELRPQDQYDDDHVFL